MDYALFRTPIAYADLDQQVVRRTLSIFDKYIEVPVFIEDAGVEQLVFGLASAALPAEIRTSGLAFLDGAVAVTGFVSSLAFGALWSVLGPGGAVKIFLAALVVALATASFVLLRVPRGSDMATVANEEATTRAAAV